MEYQATPEQISWRGWPDTCYSSAATLIAAGVEEDGTMPQPSRSSARSCVGRRSIRTTSRNSFGRAPWLVRDRCGRAQTESRLMGELRVQARKTTSGETR
jgi:hypothetical protein